MLWHEGPDAGVCDENIRAMAEVLRAGNRTHSATIAPFLDTVLESTTKAIPRASPM